MSKSTLVRSTILLVYALIAYALIFWQGQENTDSLQLYIVSALALYFAFGVGVAGQIIFDWRVQKSFRAVFWNSSAVVLLASAVLVLINVETIICLIMALPIGLGPLALGILATRDLIRTFDKVRSAAFVLLLVPFATAQIDISRFLPERQFSVVSEITINSSAMQLWSLAQNIGTIDEKELPLTLTHTLMRAPRPVSAETLQGVRYARWTKGVYFEEIMTEALPGKTLAWTFRFPDLEAMQALDYRVSPVGPEVTMRSGRYDFQPLKDGSTKVILTTTYDLKTPLNAYFSAWGTLFINDFHMAVLHVLKTRAEG
ncbi:MAG: hypothetical protein ACRBCL_14910 [Maritimibacter sp.]